MAESLMRKWGKKEEEEKKDVFYSPKIFMNKQLMVVVGAPTNDEWVKVVKLYEDNKLSRDL